MKRKLKRKEELTAFFFQNVGLSLSWRRIYINGISLGLHTDLPKKRKINYFHLTPLKQPCLTMIVNREGQCLIRNDTGELVGNTDRDGNSREK